MKPTKPTKPSVSVIVPAYNEGEILRENLTQLCDYMKSIEKTYGWELIVVNDGSTDGTGEIAEAFARTRDNVRVLHHVANFRLGQALRSAFKETKGDYVIAMDSDMSYSPDHIEKMLQTMIETGSQIVIASPYMSGGKISNVPWFRKVLSIWANRFLSITARGKINTITGMVRAFDRRFLRALDLKAKDVDINHEIIFKAQLLGARIVEIPAHLDWGFQKSTSKNRRSSTRLLRHFFSCLGSGFMFRPIMFFIVPGLVLMLLASYTLLWVFIHTVNHYEKVSSSLVGFDARFSAAVGAAFQQSPHSFFVGSISLVLAIQLISLGILALQNKRYFEDLFHISTTLHRYQQESDD